MATTSRNRNVAGVGESRMPSGARSDESVTTAGHGNRIVTDMGKHGNAQKSGTTNNKSGLSKTLQGK